MFLNINWDASSSPLTDDELFLEDQRAITASPLCTGREGGGVDREVEERCL